jgi:hypothetical protein
LNSAPFCVVSFVRRPARVSIITRIIATIIQGAGLGQHVASVAAPAPPSTPPLRRSIGRVLFWVGMSEKRSSFSSHGCLAALQPNKMLRHSRLGKTSRPTRSARAVRTGLHKTPTPASAESGERVLRAEHELVLPACALAFVILLQQRSYLRHIIRVAAVSPCVVFNMPKTVVQPKPKAFAWRIAMRVQPRARIDNYSRKAKIKYSINAVTLSQDESAGWFAKDADCSLIVSPLM